MGMRKKRQLTGEMGYTDEKAASIIKDCVEKSIWAAEAVFPADEEERLYCVRVDTSYTFEQTVEDSQNLRGTQNIDAEAAGSLLEQGGMFGCDAAPAVAGLASKPAASSMAIAEGLTANPGAKPKIEG